MFVSVRNRHESESQNLSSLPNPVSSIFFVCNVHQTDNIANQLADRPIEGKQEREILSAVKGASMNEANDEGVVQGTDQ